MSALLDHAPQRGTTGAVLVPDIVVRGAGCVVAPRHVGELCDVKEEQSVA